MKQFSVKKLQVWALVIALFMAHLFFRSVAHADEGGGWQARETLNGECFIAFPVAPQLLQQSMKMADGNSRLNYDIYLAPFEDKGVFLLLIATYPGMMPGGHETAGLEGLVRGIVGQQKENTLVYANWVDHAGVPAVSFLVQNQTSYFRGHALMIGNKLFLVAMEGRKGTLEENLFNRFLKSFHLQKPKSSVAPK
ncbi:MAG: hypothetical protein RL235_1192 [Chlamydiota bacterium]|jgi:hypothetical protein